MKHGNLFAVTIAAIMLFTPQAKAQQAAQEIEILFDASRSMHDAMENSTRLEAAKKSLETLAGQIAPGTRVGLRVFGTTPVHGNVRESCFDSKLLIPVGPFDPGAMAARARTLEAHGQTPLGHSLELAAGDFTPSPAVKKTIILISDGEESCGKDPVAVVKNLQAQGIDLKVHAIGFAVDPRTRAQLQQISQLTGGTYKDAQNSAELSQSLEEAAEKEMLLKAGRSQGDNLLAASAGARIISAGNEDAAYTIDGSEETYASLNAGEQTVFAFKDNQPVLLESFALPVFEQGGSNPKRLELSGSAENPESGFFPVASLTFKNKVDFKDIYQQVKIDPPAAVRYLKVTAGPGFNGNYADHYEWRAFGKPLGEEEFRSELAGRKEIERNLIAREAGGQIAAASAGGLDALIDGSGRETGEEPVILETGQEVVFGFAGGQSAYLTKFAVPIDASADANCKKFEVSVSEDSPASGFRHAGTFETANMLIGGNPLQSFDLAQVLKAKFVKVKLLSDHAGYDYCYVTELLVYGTFARPEGYEETARIPTPARASASPAEEAAAEAPIEEEIEDYSEENGR